MANAIKKKSRLESRAQAAHSRAEKRGEEAVGTRTVNTYSNPRQMGGTYTEKVYKREQKLREKAKNVKESSSTPSGKTPVSSKVRAVINKAKGAINLPKLKPGGGKPNYSKSVGNPNLTLGDKIRMKCNNISCKNKARSGRSGQWSR
jgi:hypothetical protein